MDRRTFNFSLVVGLLFPTLKLVDKPKIISCGIITYFNLEPTFTQGELRIYEPIDPVPIVEVTLDYSDGTYRKFSADKKTWKSRRWLDWFKPKDHIDLSEDSKTLKVYINKHVCQISEMKEILEKVL